MSACGPAPESAAHSAFACRYLSSLIPVQLCRSIRKGQIVRPKVAILATRLPYSHQPLVMFDVTPEVFLKRLPCV